LTFTGPADHRPAFAFFGDADAKRRECVNQKCLATREVGDVEADVIEDHGVNSSAKSARSILPLGRSAGTKQPCACATRTASSGARSTNCGSRPTRLGASTAASFRPMKRGRRPEALRAGLRTTDQLNPTTACGT
jgi:hypothetical protein